MKITVMCGAGAMSTFVAHRLRRACAAAHRDDVVEVTTLRTGASPDTAVVLIGHHVPRDHAGVERARAQGAEVIELPPDIAQDLDGSRTLALVERALAAEPPPAGPGADVLTEPLNDTVTDKGV